MAFTTLDRRRLRTSTSLQRLVQRRRIVQQDPLNNRKRQAAILDQVVVKLAQAEVSSLLVAIFSQQPHNLPLANHVGNLLRWTRSRAGSFTRCGFAIQAASFHEVVYCLIKSPLAGVQIHIHANSRGAVTREPEYLSLA